MASDAPGLDEEPAFVALDFPFWIRWGKRRGASIDTGRLAVFYPDHRIAKRCCWCARPCTGRRRSWCSETCRNKFYLLWSWPRLSLYIWKRDGGKCRRCERETPGGEIDHIVPIRDGGTDDPANLRLLCHDCHVAVGYEQRAARKTAAAVA